MDVQKGRDGTDGIDFTFHVHLGRPLVQNGRPQDVRWTFLCLLGWVFLNNSFLGNSCITPDTCIKRGFTFVNIRNLECTRQFPTCRYGCFGIILSFVGTGFSINITTNTMKYFFKSELLTKNYTVIIFTDDLCLIIVSIYFCQI